jgi:hypothetical protein
MVEYFFNKGVDANFETLGKNALELALEHKNMAVVNFFIHKTA